MLGGRMRVRCVIGWAESRERWHIFFRAITPITWKLNYWWVKHFQAVSCLWSFHSTCNASCIQIAQWYQIRLLWHLAACASAVYLCTFYKYMYKVTLKSTCGCRTKINNYPKETWLVAIGEPGDYQWLEPMSGNLEFHNHILTVWFFESTCLR